MSALKKMSNNVGQGKTNEKTNEKFHMKSSDDHPVDVNQSI